MFEGFVKLVPPELADTRGSVFFSGRSAWDKPSSFYLIGLNPHGTDHTIGDSLKSSREDPDQNISSAYIEQDWGKGRGNHRFQKAVAHLCATLNIEPTELPASNLIFVGGNKPHNWWDLAISCWPFHAAVIRELRVKFIFCLGNDADEFVRHQLGPVRKIGELNAPDGRFLGWAHRAKTGPVIVELPHPSRGYHWQTAGADPMPWVKGICDATMYWWDLGSVSA